MLENYLKLIWAYLKIGLFGFGGGYAMLSLIQREVVDSGWISSQMFTDIVAISQMTPGPIGINSATYIGYVVTGSVLGSLVTTITVVLPPFILTLIAAHYIERHRQSPFIKGASSPSPSVSPRSALSISRVFIPSWSSFSPAS